MSAIVPASDLVFAAPGHALAINIVVYARCRIRRQMNIKEEADPLTVLDVVVGVGLLLVVLLGVPKVVGWVIDSIIDHVLWW